LTFQEISYRFAHFEEDVFSQHAIFGLLVWNFFDKYLVGQWRRTAKTYPVYRLLKPVKLIKEIIH